MACYTQKTPLNTYTTKFQPKIDAPDIVTISEHILNTLLTMSLDRDIRAVNDLHVKAMVKAWTCLSPTGRSFNNA